MSTSFVSGVSLLCTAVMSLRPRFNQELPFFARYSFSLLAPLFFLDRLLQMVAVFLGSISTQETLPTPMTAQKSAVTAFPRLAFL
jgi:hypothetical protein